MNFYKENIMTNLILKKIEKELRYIVYQEFKKKD